MGSGHPPATVVIDSIQGSRGVQIPTMDSTVRLGGLERPLSSGRTATSACQRASVGTRSPRSHARTVRFETASFAASFA